MDVLSSYGFEPQLAIPVVIVVAMAIMVYLFGFQQTSEPSQEHLAVLESAYRSKPSISYKHKGGNVSSNVKQKPKEKGSPVMNSAQNQDKLNGYVKSKNTKTSSNLIAAKPVARKKEKNSYNDKPEDFDSGDWIPAVSRKDKKNKSKKEDEKKEVVIPVVMKKPAKEDSKATTDATNVVETQNHSTQTTPAPSPAKVTPKSSPNQKEKGNMATEESLDKYMDDAPVVGSNANNDKDDSKKSDAGKSESTSASEKDSPVLPQEDGAAVNTWEEAKSRGNRKRRVRKE